MSSVLAKYSGNVSLYQSLSNQKILLFLNFSYSFSWKDSKVSNHSMKKTTLNSKPYGIPDKMCTIEQLNKLCISQLILVQGCAFYNLSLNPEYIGKVWVFLIDTHINNSNFLNNWTLYLNFDVFIDGLVCLFWISLYQNCLISYLTFPNSLFDEHC